MSQGARIALGIAMMLLAGCFLAMVPFMKDVSPQAGPGMAIIGLFCGVIAVACFSTASHPVTIRSVGGIIFVVSLLYVISEVRSPSVPKEGEKVGSRSQPSLYNSLGFLLLIGLPSGYAAVKGQYPGWGQHAAAFSSDRRGKKKKKRR
jgi:hypothetical protein